MTVTFQSAAEPRRVLHGLLYRSLLRGRRGVLPSLLVRPLHPVLASHPHRQLIGQSNHLLLGRGEVQVDLNGVQVSFERHC